MVPITTTTNQPGKLVPISIATDRPGKLVPIPGGASLIVIAPGGEAASP